MKPIIFYHDSCADGFGAAFAAWLKFGDEADYRAVQYGEHSPDMLADTCRDRDVYILDFSFTKMVMDHIFKAASKVVWLDHHKTAFEMWGLTVSGRNEEEWDAGHYILLDNNKSGAMLAWEYFHPGTAVPDLIQLIDDRDRWQFELDGSKALHAVLMMDRPWSFSKWKQYVEGPYPLVNVLMNGIVLLKAQNAAVQASVEHAKECVIRTETPWPEMGEDAALAANYIGSAVNCAANISEVGNELAKKSGTYGLVWWYNAFENAAICSLRSIGDYDVSAIAKQFGGGGHRNAAGFKVPMAQLLGWLR